MNGTNRMRQTVYITMARKNRDCDQNKILLLTSLLLILRFLESTIQYFTKYHVLEVYICILYMYVYEYQHKILPFNRLSLLFTLLMSLGRRLL